MRDKYHELSKETWRIDKYEMQYFSYRISYLVADPKPNLQT